LALGQVDREKNEGKDCTSLNFSSMFLVRKITQRIKH